MKIKHTLTCCFTVGLKDYWDEKFFQDMGPLSVNSVHIRELLFEKNTFFFLKLGMRKKNMNGFVISVT